MRGEGVEVPKTLLYKFCAEKTYAGKDCHIEIGKKIHRIKN